MQNQDLPLSRQVFIYFPVEGTVAALAVPADFTNS